VNGLGGGGGLAAGLGGGLAGLAGGGATGLGGGLDWGLGRGLDPRPLLNLFPFPAPKGRPPTLRKPSGAPPGTELGPLENVAETGPKGNADTTWGCAGRLGGGRTVKGVGRGAGAGRGVGRMKLGTNGATVVVTKSVTAETTLLKTDGLSLFPKPPMAFGRRGCCC
jgi:hypothetical protein